MDHSDASRSLQPARPPMPRPLPMPRGAGVPAPGGPSRLSLRHIRRGIARYWLQILALWVVGSAGAIAAINLVVKPTYEAASLLRAETVHELFVSDRAQGGADAFDSFLETQVQLLTSTDVLRAALADTRVAGAAQVRQAADAEAELRRVVEVKILPRSSLIRVSTTSKSPADAANIVNAVVKAFLDSDAEWSKGRTAKQIENLVAYEKELKAQVEEKQDEWLELASKGNIDPLAAGGEATRPSQPTRMSLTLEEFKKLREQLFRVNIELSEAEAMLNTRRGPAVDPRLEAARVAELFRSDPEVVALAHKMDDLQGQLNKHLRVVHPKNAADPVIANLRRKMASLQDQRDWLWRDRQGSLRQRVRAEGEQPTRDVAERVQALRHVKKGLEADLAKMEVINAQQGSDTVKIAIVQTALEQLNHMQSAVAHRLEQLRFESRGQARISLVGDVARPAGKPISDKRMRLMAAAPAGLLAALLGLFALLEARAGRVGSPDDLAGRVAMEVFTVPPLPATRPAVAGPGRRELEVQLEEFAHRIDHLRVAICAAPHARPGGRCILVTSAAGGEGKTSLAAQLAARCAESGARTLLIDADLRRATLGRLFDVEEGLGLTEVLRGEADVAGAMIAVGRIEGCWLIPAGAPVKDPSRVLHGPRFGAMLARLRREFDAIIIDTPPVLPVPDALILGREADGAVLAARYDESRSALVEQAGRLLTAAGVPILGAVVNGIRPQSMPYGTYAYSYQTARATQDG